MVVEASEPQPATAPPARAAVLAKTATRLMLACSCGVLLSWVGWKLGATTSWLPSSSTTTPPWASQSRGALGPAEHRGLGAPLGLDRGRRERGGLDDAGERGPAGRGVEQVVRGPPVRAEPAAPADPARRHRGLRELERVQRGTAERVGDLEPALRAGEAQVAAAVDGEAAMPARRSASRSANRPLARPPLSKPTPGGRVTSHPSTETSRQRGARVRRRPDGAAERAAAPAAAAAARRGRRSSRRPRSRRAACRRRGRRSPPPPRARRASSASSSCSRGRPRAGRR